MQNSQKIPEGWSVKKVGELGKVITGSTPPMSCPENYGGIFCWTTAQDFNSKYISDTVVKLSERGKGISRVLPPGSVLITCIASLGLNAIAKVEMATNQQINAIVPNSENSGEFIYYQISQNTNQLKRFAGAGGMMILTKGEFEKVPFVFPPLAEQEKIAEILGCWDEGIEKLSALIEKKKELKKGLMQRLLTGKTRLPGFTQPWKEVKLGEILCQVSKRNKNLDVTRVLSVTNSRGFVLPEEQFARVVASNDLTNYKIISKGEFAYNPSRVNVGSIDRLDHFENGILSPMYVIFKCTDKISSDFMKNWISTYEFNTKVRISAQGSVRETVDFNTLSSIKVYIPTDIEEQQAIADVLSKADEEIDLLNKKLEALKEQKKGLMQQLLTGQIRVKVN